MTWLSAAASARLTWGFEFTPSTPALCYTRYRRTMWHIVYLSYESFRTGRDYIGKRSTLNLHDGYLGSFTDSSFHPDARIILGYYKTSQAAIAAEIQWQKVFQVATDPQFANRSYQTSKRFECVGHTEESKQKMSNQRVGENNSMFGRVGELAPATYMRWFYNPKSGEELYSREPPPSGWIAGRPSLGVASRERVVSQEARDKMSRSQKEIPSESRYWFGKEGNATGTHWWRNLSTGETKRSKTQPGPAWIKGRK